MLKARHHNLSVQEKIIKINVEALNFMNAMLKEYNLK